ncbi:uridine kinase [Fodinicola acaciae]|uniref:uridine kinase n=1 Tax=Fodinicola acaciae TaxID=2681555 RepID=UPI0013D75589|nr:uridine kinase [Fodinicola acaciae]
MSLDNVLRQIAARIPVIDGARVGIDGVDGAGKTVFADRLAQAMSRPVVRVSADDFHNVRAIRHRRGRQSPEGFWLDSYDHDRLRAHVLETFPRYRPKAHDLATDAVVDTPELVAPPNAVLVVDGLFLHRDELRHFWHLSVFLDVPFTVSVPRMATRDGTNPDPEHVSVRRYVEGQRLYFRSCAPQLRATVLVDNTDFDAPRLLAG